MLITLFFSYKLIVLTRIVRSVLALALGAVIGKYRPKGFKNIAICLVTGAGCLSWFLMFLIYVLTVAEGMELF